MANLIEFWKSMGWVANAFSISVPLILLFMWGWRKRNNANHSKIKKFKNISGLVDENAPTKYEIIQVIKERAKIAIVDDNPEDFPLEYIRSSGYRVVVFEEISLNESEKFNDFDLVLLDIAGVVKENMVSGGLDLIKRIDSLESRPCVIAVSSKKFDPMATEFFSVADDTMKKPIKEKECEERIEELLSKRLSPHTIAGSIDRVIATSNLDKDGANYVYKLLFSYLYGIQNRSEVVLKLKKKHAFMDVDKIMHDVDIIKEYMK